MFKHILLPTDGSKLSENSIRQGIRMAKSCNAKVTALYAVPTSAFNEDDAEVTWRTDKYLSFAKKLAASAGVDCEVVKVHGDQPFKEIIKAAKKRACDLILMASHGRHGMAGFLLGSETQKVLTHSRIPVLVYR
jgi:nucleotide-binding universal stress UspA family protein